MIDRNMAKGYVYCDVDRYVSWDGLTVLTWVPTVFSVFPLVYAIFEKFTFWAIIPPIFHFCVIISFFLFRRISSKINSFSLRFLMSGITATYFSVLMLLMATFVVSVGNFRWLLYIIFFASWIVMVILFNGYILLSIKRGRYLKKVLPPGKLATALIFAFLICGSILCGIYLSDSVQCIVYILLASYVSIMGTQHFLKYYFSKKYGFTTDENGENTSPLLLPHKRKVNKRRGRLNRAKGGDENKIKRKH